MSNGTPDDRVELGRLDGAWGVSGWVKVFSFTDPVTNIFNYQPWQSDQQGDSLSVLDWKQQGPRLVARLKDIDHREAAEALRGMRIYIQADQLPSTGDEHYYWRDLIGLSVMNRAGESLGVVRQLLDASVHDVLCVERAGFDDLLIPFVPGHFIDRVDLDTGCIRVDWQHDWADAE